MSSFLPTRHRSMLVFIAIVFASCIASAAIAAPEAVFEVAFRHSISASNGEQAAVEPAANEFEALSKGESANPVLMAHAGASTAMRARTTALPGKKMGCAEDGLAMLDESLAMPACASTAGRHLVVLSAQVENMTGIIFGAIVTPCLLHRPAAKPATTASSMSRRARCAAMATPVSASPM